MARSASAAIADRLNEIDSVTALVARRALAQFEVDRTLRYAVERSIEILSEASRRLGPDKTDAHPEIQWRAIAAIGNILRHEDHATSAQIVWTVVRDDLPRPRVALDESQRRLTTGSTEI